MSYVEDCSCESGWEFSGLTSEFDSARVNDFLFLFESKHAIFPFLFCEDNFAAELIFLVLFLLGLRRRLLFLRIVRLFLLRRFCLRLHRQSLR